jgi:PIN domain nuclease of toxin-antitoxin system
MPERIVLDTHIWFWFINQEFDKFPHHWRNLIETTTRVSISPVSCFEIALAEQKGRLRLPCSVEQWLTEALEPVGITLSPITPSIASQAVRLSSIHKDPFDRLIIATAIVHQAQLASVDGKFPRYPELSTILLPKSALRSPMSGKNDL